MAIDIEAIKEFIQLTRTKKSLEEQLDGIKKEIETLSTILVDNFASEGVERMTMDGMTVFPKRIVFAKISNKEDAIKALKEAGLNEYLSENFNANSISGYVREIERNKESLPEAFGDVITIGERYAMAGTKG